MNPTARRRPLRRSLVALRPVRGELTVATVLGALAISCAFGLLAVSGWLISRASEMPPVSVLAVAIVAVRAFGIGRGLFRYLERLASHDAAFRALGSVRSSVWKQLEVLAPQGVAAFRRGDLQARLVADVDSVLDLSIRVLVPVGGAVIAGGLAVAVTWWLLPAAGVVLLVALLVGATVVPWLAVATAGRAESEVAPVRGLLTSQVGELLSGLPDVLAFGADTAALAAIEESDRTLTSIARRSALTAGLESAASVALSGVAVVGALVAALSAFSDGRLSGVNIAVVVLLPLAAYESVTGLPAAATTLVRVRSSARRLVEVVDAPAPVIEPAAQTAMPEAVFPLRLHGLTARWSCGDAAVLNGVDLVLRRGQRLAIVGPSGAGKSTLAQVLVRFVDYGGSATLGGVELGNLASDDVRRVIGLCAQDAHLFNSTIAENLRIGRQDATGAELLGALSRVGLADFVATLPDGADTKVGENGSRLSGGQRRRIVLARSLLADPQVLVLDEPTEHLDAQTAASVMTDVLAATHERTTLVVTHRLIGLEEMDQIVVLDGGVVVERGTHESLLRANGRFAAMWQIQSTARLTR